MQMSDRRATRRADYAIELEGITKEYRQWQRSPKLRDAAKNFFRPDVKTFTALDNVNLRVKPGEFVAYAGPNGAGKSTTMKLLCGMLRPTKGEARSLGYHPGKERIPLMRRTGVLFGQRSELWWDHPVEMSFEWKKAIWDIPGERYERMKRLVTDMLDLGPIFQTFVRELSLGQRMRADLGLLFLHEPELLLLDEPTLGLDVLAKRQFIEFLKHINKEKGTTVFVTSHDMDDLNEMAGRLVLIANGRVAFDGTFAQLEDVTPAASLAMIERVERKGPPVEQVIAALYKHWANSSPQTALRSSPATE